MLRWSLQEREGWRTSTNDGTSWSANTVDSNDGDPRSLCNPDRGVYERNMNVFSNTMENDRRFTTEWPNLDDD